MTRQHLFKSCIPTRATKVPSHPDWMHEVKHDGLRLIVARDGERVRLFIGNGHNWTDRYRLIVQSALRMRTRQFVLDGEAVLLDLQGRCDFDGLSRARTTRRSSCTPLTCWRSMATTCASCRCTCGRRTSPGCSLDAPRESTLRPARTELGECRRLDVPRGGRGWSYEDVREASGDRRHQRARMSKA